MLGGEGGGGGEGSNPHFCGPCMLNCCVTFNAMESQVLMFLLKLGQKYSTLSFYILIVSMIVIALIL